MFTQVLKKSAIVITLILVTHSYTHAASGIQACLEVYQAQGEKQMREIENYNQQVKQKPPVLYFHPKDFPKVLGPECYLERVGGPASPKGDAYLSFHRIGK